MTDVRSIQCQASAFFLASGLFLLAAVANAAGGGAATVGQSTGPGASAPGNAASDPPKAQPGKARAPRAAASGSRQGNSSNRERPGAPKSPASAP